MKEKLGQEPAFSNSIISQTGESHWEGGMSKRFYAACEAMKALLYINSNLTTEQLIGVAYECADELLKQEHE